MNDRSMVIYGAGNAARHVYDNLSDNTAKKVLGWIDNFREYYTVLQDRYVWTEEEFAPTYNNENILVCITNPAVVQERILSMLKRGWKNIYVLNQGVYEGKLPIMDGEEINKNSFKHYSEIKPELRYMECHVTDRCNLNCRNCFHFCNLDKDAMHCDFDEFENSLKALKKKFSNIKVIRLMGGEPLLNPELPKYIMAARKYFPRTELHVVTNGLLVLNMSEELAETMAQCNAKFDISQYPPVKNIAYKIIEKLNDYQIDFTLSAPVKYFYLRMSKGNPNPKEAFRFCPNQCHFLRNGKLYLCTHIPMLFEHKEYFDVEISEQEYMENGIDLMDESISGWDIIKKFSQASSFCRFCSSTKRMEVWDAGKVQEGDWFV